MPGSSPADGATTIASGTSRGPAREPIIVLTYPHAGGELLTRMLSASPSVVCTQGTGLLPLCHSAVTTWQNLENRDTAPSPLAVKSVRSLVSVMATMLRTRTGAARWCETASAAPQAAAAFLRIFPETTFLCLYRSLPPVITEVARAYPWGLGGSPLWPYAAGHPGNNLATIVAYWAGHTRQLADFEAEHPQSCLRVRYEDLTAQPDRCTAEISAHLRLNPPGFSAPSETGNGLPPDMDGGGTPVTGASPEQRPPLGQVPPQLLAEADELHTRLGYGPLRT
jgi:hypothetical protein